ncbi:DUF885 domain-containing protein [Simiduia curdlanivorans]|uniref:DUF885 domain-containing protein n=1 Tax=Simiduia curdlanivorans TaxID=1492769 RepID=A0ABV8V8U2_9GAMM|nr:DUF885 domain-containing protein [Simiduia curdlanivorans]MDN3639336.1 DUF885 domain-containing protein [Simiduia curdlanivorans]
MHKMAYTLSALAAALLLGACEPNTTTPSTPSKAETTTAETTQTESQKLEHWLNTRYEEQLQFSPMSLSYLGRKDLYNQIDDVSDAAHLRQLAWLEESVNQLKQSINYAALSDEAKSSFDLWIFQFEEEKADSQFRNNSYIFNQMRGPQASLPTFLMSFHKVDNRSDMEAYIERISGISRALGQYLERAKNSASLGVRAPRFALEGSLSQAQNMIAGQPFAESEKDSPIWGNAKTKIAQLQTDDLITQEEASELLDATRKALVSDLLPAYTALNTWLSAEIALASASTGASNLPNGMAYYQQRLKSITTTDMTPEEIHQLGLTEVARIKAEMDEIRKEVKFEGSLADFFVFMRTDKQFYYPNTDAGRQAYLDDSKAFLDAIKVKLPDYFGILPKADLIVKRVEPFREQPGGAQHYYTGTADGSRPGIYYAHLADMNAYSKADMETIAYHEGNPGHHMQRSIAAEMTGIPNFRTQVGFTVYTEGWALYAEKLAKEMGAFTDPYKRFGNLTAEIWRAIRLVVDTGMHAKGWTEEQAVAYFLANSSIPETAVRSEVQRYLVWPGQATAYKIGMIKIQQLRAKAETALGDKFDIRGFHDTILGGGALPVPMLEDRVDRWIATQKG